MGQMAELENTASRKVRLYIFIDALGWELAERYHFCADFLPCRYDVVTQLGYSAGAVPTILTGKTPPEHGHFSFFYYDPHHSPFRFLKYLPSFLLPDIIFSRHRIRHHISKVLKKVLGYTGYFQLYRVPFRHLPYLNYSEKRDMFIPGGMDGVPNLADAWQGRSYHISDWRKPGMFNFQEAEELLKRGSFECAFIYDAALDGFLHRHIGEPEAVRAELKRYEERMRRLYETAVACYDEVEFCVLSDHGMTPLTCSLDLRPVLGKYRWGRDYISFVDSTMARFWWIRPELKEELRAAVASAGHGHWLSEQEQERYHVNFPDHRYGDDIYLLDAGVQFAPSDMGGMALPGMHGFSPDDKDSDACFLSNRKPVVEPFWIGDYFRIMTAP